MGRLKNIAFDRQSKKIKGRVRKYWTKRADSFFDLRHAEIESEKADKWLAEISKYIPEGKRLDILDVGCGTGFFEVVLGSCGHRVCGIDLTQEMVDKGNVMLRAYGMDPDGVRILLMDAEKLAFDAESFDMVVTRNLTWTLPHPIEAYAEWMRVLKPGGILLNYDAEYAKNAHANLYSPENFAHEGVDDALKDECHKLYHMLSISSLPRPQWDVEVLRQEGFRKVQADVSFGDRVYKEKDRFYMIDRMFEIMAEK